MTIGIAGVSLASAVQFFSIHAHHLRKHTFRLETQQALRGSLDAMTRDIRLAGACLPTNTGQFVSLAGVDAPGGDSITIRTGLVLNNLACIVTSLANNVTAGTSTVPVQSSGGFTGNILGYVRHPNGSGEILPIVAAGGNTVTFGAGLSQDYPSGAGVYAIDERVYRLDFGDPSNPKLSLTVNRGIAEAFAAGVSNLQIQYVLNRNCPACDVVNLPANTAEWQLVNEVQLTASVQTVGAVLPDDYVTLVATSTAKPRNLLP